jgi:pathogenicity locus Cdd1 protein
MSHLTATKRRSAPRPARLEDLPNIGRAVAGDLRLLGIERPAELRGRNPRRLYDDLCRKTRTRHDPCLLDTFMAVVDFMNGAPARPWWAYTAERKRILAAENPKKTRTRRS